MVKQQLHVLVPIFDVFTCKSSLVRTLEYRNQLCYTLQASSQTMSLLQAGLPAADINKMKYHLVGFSKGKHALQLHFPNNARFLLGSNTSWLSVLLVGAEH